MSPKIENAPGLIWRQLKGGWEAMWRARTDIVKKGFTPKNVRLWNAALAGYPEPNQFDADWISDRCNVLQSEMLTWARGGLPEEEKFDGTIASLIRCYLTDQDSSYRKVRYHTRELYDSLCGTLTKDLGEKRIAEITARDLLRWHERYSDRIAQGHSLVGMLRNVMTFGSTLLGSKDCRELKMMLADMRFKAPKPRAEQLTAEMVIAIRKEAHRQGRPSIALAQALQFEMTFRQKDIIGEWVPISEPGLSAVTWGNEKWFRGLDWKEIDSNWICKHVTSKRQKEVVVNLQLAPMVLEELGVRPRDDFPASGPVIIDEKKDRPYTAANFRLAWRAIANVAGVPKCIRNMDTRAGAISEATGAGIPLEQVRKAATHSDIGMTQRYSRGDADAVEQVMRGRVSKRNEPKS